MFCSESFTHAQNTLCCAACAASLLNLMVGSATRWQKYRLLLGELLDNTEPSFDLNVHRRLKKNVERNTEICTDTWKKTLERLPLRCHVFIPSIFTSYSHSATESHYSIIKDKLEEETWKVKVKIQWWSHITGVH